MLWEKPVRPQVQAPGERNLPTACTGSLGRTTEEATVREELAEQNPPGLGKQRLLPSRLWLAVQIQPASSLYSHLSKEDWPSPTQAMPRIF